MKSRIAPTLCAWICSLTVGLAASNAGIDTMETNTTPFYMGAYLYSSPLAKVAKEQNLEYHEFLETHLRILKQHGVNALHMTTGRPEGFSKTLDLLHRYDMKVIPQLSFAYFNPQWSETTLMTRAAKAGQFIQSLIEHPAVLAWSVKEEVAHHDINKLSKYYFMIREHAPEAEFAVIHNNLGAARDQPVPDPVIMGTDRYAFWWELSGGGYLASPASALDWIRNQAAAYHGEAAKRGADFMFVTTAAGYFRPADKWVDVDRMSYPTTAQEKQELSEKSLRFAEEGRMGWVKVATPTGPHYGVWKYYRMPENCLKASAWTAVLEGARLYFQWLYMPPSRKMLTMDVTQATLNLNRHKVEEECILWSLAGRPGEANPQLQEFAEVAAEIRQYEHIITRMHKLPDSPVVPQTSGVFNRAFSFPGIRGKVIVLHNANVGTWPCNSRYMFKDDDQIVIDGKGNLVGYSAFTEPVTAVFQVTEKMAANQVYDLLSGSEIVDKAGAYSVPIGPGGGRFVFIGPEGEMAMLRQRVSR